MTVPHHDRCAGTASSLGRAAVSNAGRPDDTSCPGSSVPGRLHRTPPIPSPGLGPVSPADDGRTMTICPTTIGRTVPAHLELRMGLGLDATLRTSRSTHGSRDVPGSICTFPPTYWSWAEMLTRECVGTIGRNRAGDPPIGRPCRSGGPLCRVSTTSTANDRWSDSGHQDDFPAGWSGDITVTPWRFMVRSVAVGGRLSDTK